MKLKDVPFEGCKRVSLQGMPMLYYKPEKNKSLFGEFETSPSSEDLIHRYFVSDGDKVYGYYSGLTALNNIHGTTQVPAIIEIITNRIDRDTNYNINGIRYNVYKSDKEINKQNHFYLEILDTIEEYYDYFEEDAVKCIKWVVKELKLNEQGFMELINDYSDITKEVIENVFRR